MTTAVRTVKEINEELALKSKALHAVFEEAGEHLDLSLVKSIEGDTAAKAAEIKKRNDELTALGVERDQRMGVEGAAAQAKAMDEHLNAPVTRITHPSGQDPAKPVYKSLGIQFKESPAYTGFVGRRGPSIALAQWDPVELKTVFRTGAGWDPENLRTGRVELDPQRPIAVIDHIPMLPTQLDVIRYMEETTFTNNAVETAESTATTASDLIGEAALALTERTQNVEWLPVFLPVTQQQMEDVLGIDAYVNQRLQFMLRQRLDSQILVGDGVSPNILGTNNVTGINTRAKGADPTPDAIYKGMDLVRTVGFTEPNVMFSHPNDWQDIRLLKTADGIYLWGSPADAGPTRIWGLPVVLTTAQTENTMILGDYVNFSALYTKRGITLEVSDSHAHYFTRGMLAIRADMRIGMVHFRPEAFCTITGV